jgi:hypothetical protein
VPENKEYVRAKLTFSLFAFFPEGMVLLPCRAVLRFFITGENRTKVVRAIHANPAGNVPSSVINTMAGRMIKVPRKLEKVFARMESK